MDADAYNLKTVFAHDRQLMVPLFQRPYVWDRKNQWEPLWKDIQTVADRMLSGDGHAKPHFLGAVVLDQLLTPLKKVERRSIIDGQQRLTTLQILFAAFRDVCGEVIEGDGENALQRAAEKLIYNDDPLAEGEQDRFKVWPTNVDREPYSIVMTAGSAKEARRLLQEADDPTASNSRVAEAYFYFSDAILEWLSGENEGNVEDRLGVLLRVLRERLRLVVIDMDDDDDAQMIFETLNARGTPLLPSDLVKNLLFRKAELEGQDVSTLYERHWKAFDAEHDFWRKEVREGRVMRPRIDIFLRHYLTLMKSSEVSVAELFGEFQEFVEEAPERSAEWHLHSLRQYAAHFTHFIRVDQDSREGVFFDRLEQMETTTVFPFLLGLYQELKGRSDGEQVKLGILQDLESFLVRRMVCRLTTRGYNRLFLDLLAQLRKEGEFSCEAVRTFLVTRSGESARWPDDVEFRGAWLSQPLFARLKRARVRMLLRALDEALHYPKMESYYMKAKPTIEHILPIHWREHWPLPKRDETPEEHVQRVERRNKLLHTLGNLTFLNEKLNPAVSNGPFERKKQEILANSMLRLNRFLQDVDTWDEEHILARGENLFEFARRIWPYPKEAAT